MSDITERLRRVGHIDYALMNEAADEIQRLRETNRKFHRRLQVAEAIHHSARDYLKAWLEILHDGYARRKRERGYVLHILRDIDWRVAKLKNRVALEEDKETS